MNFRKQPLTLAAADATAAKEADEQRSSRQLWADQPAFALATVAVLLGGLLLGAVRLKTRKTTRHTRQQVAAAEALRTLVLANGRGVEVHISPVGAAIMQLLVPDRTGELADIALGFDSNGPYADGTNPYFGVVVGRCANRIAKAQFQLDGKAYKLAANNGPNALHGGEHGWSEQIWRAENVEVEGHQAVQLTYHSRDGEEGYPGNVEAKVVYVLTDGDHGTTGRLRCLFTATTDASTPVNMAQHSYWNLGGHASGDILNHRLTISADRYTPVDDTAIPTGELAAVSGTAMDFRTPSAIGARIEQAPGGDGYDHNYVLNDEPSSTDKKLRQAAVLQDPASGRSLEVATDAPGLQFYSGNFLDGSVKGKGGAAYGKHAGVALETQAFPNSINQPSFPNVILRPGETYRHEVSYVFRAK